MAVISKLAKWVRGHLQETWKDISKTPDDIVDAVRNSILRKPQTLRDYNVTSALTQKELTDTLCSFHSNCKNDITTWITNQLLLTMDIKNFPIDIDKIEWIYDKFIAIQKEYGDNPISLKAKEKEILGQLTPQDIFSLQIYNINSNFWNTHIKDWNKLKDLILYRPHIPRPEKPEWEPQKPIRSDSDNIDDFYKALKTRKKDVKIWQKSPEYKKRDERTEKTERMKAILNMGVFNKIWNWTLKRISSFLERWGWAWVQHFIEAYFRPNILDMSPEEEELLKHILISVVYGNQKVFIVLNHETFANIPMTIVKFMQIAHNIWIENVNEYFTTIIGPLLATHKKQNTALNSISNILVTHPADNKIPWAKRITNHQQHNTGQQLEKDLNKENPKWQIYFCAPSGTRDIVHYDNNWIPQIFIPDESRWSNITTTRLLRNLKKSNPKLKVFAISTNTTDLKKPNKETWVSPNNNKWNKNATVSMHIEEVDMSDLTTEQLVENIEKNITYPIPSEERKPSKNPIKRKRTKWKKYYDYDEDWLINEVHCATKIPAGIFKYIKKFTKTPSYATTGKLPARFFNSNKELNIMLIQHEMMDNIMENLIKNKKIISSNKEIICKNDLPPEILTYINSFAESSEFAISGELPSKFFDDKQNLDIELIRQEIINTENLSYLFKRNSSTIPES